MKKIQFTVLTLILLISVLGCAGKPRENPPETVPPAGQKLLLWVVESEESCQTLVPPEELGENTSLTLVYSNLSEVSVQLDSGEVPLAHAIRDGFLTLPEILGLAQTDARQGYCEESYVSEHGLTHFSYRYPQYELHLTYDLYETPDGRQTLIQELYVSDVADHYRSHDYFYPDPESEWGYLLDREDWGLDFTVADVTPGQITLDCTQQGGQQIGTFQIEDYLLFPMEPDTASDGGPGYLAWIKPNSDGLPVSIPMNASSQITLDWSSIAGQLAPGSYYVHLSVSDIYDESAVHPLMENFTDKQSYKIAFTIE